MVELRLLQYFVVVAEELHFGRAAARLHIAQPPLSQQIRKLEQTVGARLLSRSSRRVELTEAGRLFLEEARRTLAQAERAVEVARRAGRGELGRLRVGFVGSATYRILPRVLRQFRVRYPDVELTLLELTTAQQETALLERRIDVGILRPPVSAADLQVETLLREPLVAALPEGHPLSQRERLSLADLRAEPFILFPHRLGPGLHQRVLEACKRAGFAPRVVQEATQMETITALVAGGLGVSLVPASISLSRRPGLRFLPVADAPVAETAAAWRRGERLPVLERFLEALRLRKSAAGAFISLEDQRSGNDPDDTNGNEGGCT